MACSYSLKIGEQVRQYENYQDLFLDLIDNKILIETGKANDIVFSQDGVASRKAETIALLERIKSDKTVTKGVYDGNTGELREVVGPGYISVTDYVEKATKLDGSVFVTPYDEKQFRIELLRHLVQDGMSQAEAAKQVDKDLDEFRRVAEVASNLHAVVRAYFNGAKTKDALYNMFNANFNIESIEKMVDGLLGVEAFLKQRHGENVEILSGLTMSSNIVGETDKLLGTLDIVAVDDKGKAHIYQVKGSSKQYGLMLDVRLRKTDYQLAFYRHMLASRGVSVRDMSLNTIPVRISLQDGEVDNLIFQNIEDRTALTNKDGVNRLQWGSGEFYNNVNQKIEVSLSQPSTVTSKVSKNVRENLEKFFPGKRIQTLRYEKSREQFIAKHVHDSPDPEQGRWAFRDAVRNTYIYIKEDSPKDQNSELIRKVDGYLERCKSDSIEYMRDMYNKMEDVLKGTSPIGVLTSERKAGMQSSFLTANLEQYIKGDWKLVENEGLMQLGIMALQNEVSKLIDLVSMSFMFGDINANFNMGLGKTMLGCFKKDYADIASNRFLMRASNGNIDLMRVMLALNEMPNWFNGIFKIGNIKVMNVQEGTATTATTKEIVTTFDLLCRETGVKNNMDLVEFVNDLELFNQVLISASRKSVLDSDLTNNIFSDLEKVNVQNSKEVLKVLRNALAKMEKTYPELLQGTRLTALENSIKNNNPQAEVYAALYKTILAYEGVPFTQGRKLHKYTGSLKDGDFIGGVNLTNPTTLTDPNLRRVVELTRNSFNNMTQELTDEWHPFLSKTVNKLWEAKGYSWTLNTILGNQKHLYSNMFEKNPDGLLNGYMLLKNPYDPNSKLQPEEREFLKDFLWRINKLRFNLENESEDSQKVRDLKKQKSWFWLPLTEATKASKVQQVKPKEYAQREWTNISDWIKKKFKRAENDVYNEQEELLLSSFIERNEIFNRFSLSEGNETDRMELLSQHSADFWELNLETVYSKYLYAHVRKKHLDRTLPLIKGLKLMGLVYGHQTNQDMTIYNEYIDNYVQNVLHNQALLDKEAQDAMAWIRPMKYLASSMALGFNVTTGVRSLLESFWKTPAKIMGKFFGGKEVFGFEDYVKAVGIMIGDTGDFMNNVTLIEMLNRKFRMQNMDTNRIAQELMSNKSGLLNATDRLMFWTSTAPDYFNRMTMLIALMIHDGCWEALSISDEGLKYDWKKDKRFEAYATGNKSDMKKYNDQRAKYFFLIDSMNKDKGLQLTEGDALPLPYTNSQMDALKTFSDTTYGFYDHDVRAMFEKFAIGSLFSQFRTYVTATRTTYLLSPDHYNAGEIVQIKDEKTGEPMFWKIELNEDGQEVRVPTTEDTGIPIYGPQNSYMEGIVYTLWEGLKEWRSHGFKSAWDEILSVDAKRNNMKLFAYNMAIALLVSSLMAFLIKMWAQHRKENAGPKTLSSVVGDLAFDTFSRSFLGSMQDFNLVDTITSTTLDSEPAALGILSNLFTSTNQALFGDRTLESWMRSNVGAYRSLNTFASGVKELGEGFEGSVNQLNKQA